MIQLIATTVINLMLAGICIYFLVRINRMLKHCFECYTLIRSNEVQVQNSICLHVYNLLSQYKYNEKVLISEFLDQRTANRKIVMDIEEKNKHSNKKRSYVELIQKSPFVSHIKIYFRLLFTFLIFLAYIITSMLIMFNMQSTAKLSTFAIDTCQSKFELENAFRQLYYEFYTNDTLIYTLPTEDSYEQSLVSA